jgi:hypothetical protein
VAVTSNIVDYFLPWIKGGSPKPSSWRPCENANCEAIGSDVVRMFEGLENSGNRIFGPWASREDNDSVVALTFGDNSVLVTLPGVAAFFVKASNRCYTLENHPAVDVGDLRFTG